jgi:transcriptional regulator with XRE-family HTH domain
MWVKSRGPRQQLADQLEWLRKYNRLSLDEAAKRMRFSRSKLGRIETGETLIHYHELKSALDLYGVTADRWPEYFELHEAAEEPGWWKAYGLSSRGYVPLESDATAVRHFTLGYVPGLLQTEGYAKAMFQSGQARFTGNALHNALSVRMIRQQRLTSAENPLAVLAVIDESVLYRPVGGAQVMGAQLAHLLEVGALDTVTVQILPVSLGAHPAQAGGFTLLSFDDPDMPDVAYAEHPLGAVNTDRESAVAKARLRFDRLRSDALSTADSAVLIRAAAEQYAGPA